MEAVYMRETKRHAWKLQALRLGGSGMELAKALEKQARERGYNVQYAVAIGKVEYNACPQICRNGQFLMALTPHQS